MKYLDANTIFEHWDKTPQNLRDVVSDVDVMSLIENIAKEYHVSEDKEIRLERLVRFVFLGIIHRQDLQKEIRSFLNIDNRVALELYGDLDRKVLYPYHKDIDKNYVMFSVGANKEKASDVVVGKKQVVLKDNKNESGQTLDLRKETTENFYGAMGRVAPKKIGLINEDIKNQSIKDDQVTKNKNDLPVLPIQNEEKNKDIVTNIQQSKQGNAVDISKTETKKEKSNEIKGPVILHRRDEIKAVGADKKYTGYKNVSAGGVLGSFGTPFFGAGEYKNIVGANVEMPVNDDKNIKISKKNDNKVKHINYSELKSDVASLAEEEIKEKDTVENTVGDTSLPNSKPDDDREIIDLSSMKIINK